MLEVPAVFVYTRPAMASSLRWSVVIPTRDTRELTLSCLASVPREPCVEIVVVDDGSRDGTASAIGERFPEVTIVALDASVGFTKAVNLGAAHAAGERLLFLNSDTELERRVWSVLDAAFRDSPNLGIVGARLAYQDETPQWSGGQEPSLPWLLGLASGLPALLGRLPGVRALRPVSGSVGGSVDWVPAAAMAVRRQVWEEIGPLDERFRLYCQDLDFCTRAGRAGWQVAVLPSFRVVHHHGVTVGVAPGAVRGQNPELLWTDLLRWARKHRGEMWERRAALALRMGVRMRLLGRWIVSRLTLGRVRKTWSRDTLSYRRALLAIARAPDLP